MRNELFVFEGPKIKNRADSYFKLLQYYLGLERDPSFRLISEWIEDLDECECEEGESCPVCEDYGDKNIVFELDANGEDTRFLKIPEEITDDQEAMAKWFFENSDILEIGDDLYEGEEIENEEDYEVADKGVLIKIKDYDKLVFMGEKDFVDFSFYDLGSNETIFKIEDLLQSGTRKSYFITIKDEL